MKRPIGILDSGIGGVTVLKEILKMTSKKVFVSLNKNMHSKDLNFLKEILLELEKLNIEGILYYDVSVVNIKQELSLKKDLVWSAEHLVTNSLSINFWKDEGVNFAYLSSDITIEEIKKIKNETDVTLMMNIFGYVPIFTSYRHLIKNYLKTFNLKTENVRNVNFIEFVNSKNLEGLDEHFITPILEKCRTTEETVLVKREMQIINKYFNIEASGIFSKNAFLGTLMLFKDVTQHVIDRTTIENNQNILMERERLASLGQLIGGIAHNLKTPIMSISGAAEGLNDLIKEYEASVGDPEVTVQDHHDIANDMKNWIRKIKSYTEYMSDIITAVKGQAVTMSEEQAVTFTLDELVKRVDILMRHELKNALVSLNIQMKTDPNTVLNGNINSLVQVINNMVSNAIQAYDGKPDNKINLILEQSSKNVVISVQDFGNGLPEKVQDKLFKEMITTKGKNGTGLGLFMSYSTIRAHFKGNITFETIKGKGTTFHIILPM